MTEAPFRPFDTHLDEAAALATLRAAADGADDGELFLERRRAESIVLDDGRIKQATYERKPGLRPASRPGRGRRLRPFH